MSKQTGAKTLTTREVARLCHVSEATIKRWADEGHIASVKTAGGHRRFHACEVARFRRECGLLAPVETSATDISRPPGRPRPPGDNCAALFAILLDGDTAAAAAAFGKAHLSGIGLTTIFDQILTPVMASIGAAWYRGEVSVAQEHLATHTALMALHKFHAAIGDAPPHGLKAVVCGIEEDLHELPVHLAHILLQHYGWTVLNLGANTPVFALQEMTRRLMPELVCLSATLMPNAERAARDYAALQQFSKRHNIALVLGGAAFADENMRQRFPADLHAQDFTALAAFARRLEPAEAVSAVVM